MIFVATVLSVSVSGSSDTDMPLLLLVASVTTRGCLVVEATVEEAVETVEGVGVVVVVVVLLMGIAGT